MFYENRRKKAEKGIYKEYLISIIVPFYNPGGNFRRCLDSLIHQTYGNLEIILIDDGSTDGSYEIAKEYAQIDKRVVLEKQKNSGVSHARNRGIQIAHGDYFSFIDSDDYLDLDTYEYLLGILNEKKVDVVNYEHYITYPTHEVEHKLLDSDYGWRDKKGAQYQLLYNVQFACNKLFPQKIIQGLTFDESILRGEDTLFAKMALDRAESFWFDKRPLYHYVQSEESAVRGKFRKSQLTIMRLYDVCIPFYKEKYPELLNGFFSYMAGQLISIFYDMWSDETDFKDEQSELVKVYEKYYKEAIKCKEVSKKQKLKYRIFHWSPMIFCRIHKILWK